MDLITAPWASALVGGALVLPALRARLLLSRAKHRSVAGHARMSLRLARALPGYTYDDADIFGVDGAPSDIVAKRRAGFERLAALYSARFAHGRALTAEAAESISDLQFTARYRVPFQFAPYVRRHLAVSAVVIESQGTCIVDADGNALIDLAGSYGVNVFGYDFYKRCLDDAHRKARDLGPVLGSYHPRVLEVVKLLRAVSGLDEVSFHMSGTEAVMQAVRLARYHTKRNNIVRFCGAYHGFWGEVQPGVGNPTPARDTLTLSDMSALSLEVLRTRKDIACVLVNPLQGLHPNRPAAADSSLVDSSRSAGFDRAAYTAWLHELRAICSERGIALIFDEVFLGFRIARGGAQEYFGVAADLVTYGKTLGGGMPVGVVCGKARWMKRFREDAPADICFARGTFNAHPYVIAAMHTFLTRVFEPEMAVLYEGLDARWNARSAQLNTRLAQAGLAVRVANFSSVWTLLYPQPGRYNWMLQYYLRAEGIALSWVGTGRLIFSMNFSDADFEDVCVRFIRAAEAMADDGFFGAPRGPAIGQFGAD